MPHDRLLDVERTEKRKGTTKAIVLVDTSRCLRCGSTDLETIRISVDALFFHGGYGATKQTTIERCRDCETTRVIDTTEVRPPRRGAR